VEGRDQALPKGSYDGRQLRVSISPECRSFERVHREKPRRSDPGDIAIRSRKHGVGAKRVEPREQLRRVRSFLCRRAQGEQLTNASSTAETGVRNVFFRGQERFVVVGRFFENAGDLSPEGCERAAELAPDARYFKRACRSCSAC
jgi:hypothetical protein